MKIKSKKEAEEMKGKAKKVIINTPIKGVDKKERTIEVYSSTNDWDRYGERFEADAFKKGMENYLKNPVFLWGHDYSLPPIGKGVEHSFDSKGLIQKFKFAETDMAEDTLSLYEGKFLNAVSVGFIPTEIAFEEQVEGSGVMGAVFKQAELLEVSAVPIPANPGALLTNGLFGPAMRLFAPERDPEEVQEWLRKNLKSPEEKGDETLEKVLKYFKEMGKTLKGGKVSDDAAKSILIQVNNVIRTLVYGEQAPPVDTDEMTDEQEKAIEKEAAFLLGHLKDGGDLKELEDILALVGSEG